MSVQKSLEISETKTLVLYQTQFEMHCSGLYFHLARMTVKFCESVVSNVTVEYMKSS